MKRYSTAWWLAIVPTTAVVGVPIFFVLSNQTDWGVPGRVALALACAFAVDLAIAAWMERIAPTRVSIAPGERLTVADVAMEEAIVIDGFDASAEGRVSVRGETWAAIRSPDDTADIAAGMTVSVVDRDGLSLVVSASRE